MIELIFFIMLGIEKPNSMPFQLEALKKEYIGYTVLNGGVEVVELFQVGGEIKTYITPSEIRPTTFFPIYTEYLFYAKMKYKLLEIGIEHLCVHNSDNWYWQEKERIGFDRIYIKLGTE